MKKIKETKVHCSIRLTPKTKEALIKKHGSLQYAIDYMIALYLKKEKKNE